MNQRNFKEPSPHPPDLQGAELLWDEYKYRHEHCWKTIYRLTAATVLMSVIPYLHEPVVEVIQYSILGPPILAVGLLVFGMLRMHRELDLLAQVKCLHRERQKELYGFHRNQGRSTFDSHMRSYLWLLLVLAVVNIGVLCAKWIPAVLERTSDVAI